MLDLSSEAVDSGEGFLAEGCHFGGLLFESGDDVFRGFGEESFARGGGIGQGKRGQAQAFIQTLAGGLLGPGLVIFFPAFEDFELVVVEEQDIEPLAQFLADIIGGFIGGEHIPPEGLVILGHGMPEIDEPVKLAGLGGEQGGRRRQGRLRGRRAGRGRRTRRFGGSFS